MIELGASIALIIMTLIGYFTNWFNFKELLDVSYESLLVFIIFGRCFMTISYMQTVAEKKRISFESIIFIVSTLCFGTLYLKHTNIFPFLDNIYPQIIIFIICFIIFLLVKIYVIKNNTYGLRYLIWQIIDIVLLSACFFINLYINPKNLTFSNGIFAILMMLALGAVNEHIIRKLLYWTILNDFKAEINLMIAYGNISKITYPPEKNLETDPIYSKCVFILKNSTFRINEVHILSEIVRKSLLKYGYTFSKAQKISSEFLMVLNNNLMRRKYDNTYIPSILLNFIYNINRKK